MHDLLVTLEDVMHGCTKHVKVTRSRLNPDGRSLRSEEKVLNVVVKKGWKAGTKITFPREGDETPGSGPADITFILRDEEHPTYRRDGSNIVYTAQITLKEVSSINICFTLTGHTILVTLNSSGIICKSGLGTEHHVLIWAFEAAARKKLPDPHKPNGSSLPTTLLPHQPLQSSEQQLNLACVLTAPTDRSSPTVQPLCLLQRLLL